MSHSMMCQLTTADRAQMPKAMKGPNMCCDRAYLPDVAADTARGGPPSVVGKMHTWPHTQ